MTTNTKMDIEVAQVASTANDQTTKHASFLKVSLVVLVTLACGVVAGGGFGAGFAVGRTSAGSNKVVLVRTYVGDVVMDGDRGEHLHGAGIQNELQRLRDIVGTTSDRPLDQIHAFQEEISFSFASASAGAHRRLQVPSDVGLSGQQINASVTLDEAASALAARGIYDFTVNSSATVTLESREGTDTTPQLVIVRDDATGEEIFYQCEGTECYELTPVRTPPADGNRRKLFFWEALVVIFVVSFIAGSTYVGVKRTSKRSGGCLPADALVTAMLSLQSPPQVLPIAQVPHGAMVLSTAGYSPIYLFSHFTERALTPMAHIETRSGHAVELTDNHYLRACDAEGACAFTAAQNVAIGMRVELLAANGTVVTSEVTATSVVDKAGLFNPHTIAGDLVVASRPSLPGGTGGSEVGSEGGISGIVVSDASEWFAEGYVPEAHIPALYHAVLAPVRQLFRLNPEWLTRFHEHTVKKLEAQAEKDSGLAQDLRSRAVAGSLDTLGTYEIAKSAAVTGFAGLLGGK